ncbi:ribosome small subunit-dependent GTPase A [Flavobacteriales bacterium]|nr:ribosome small subunit-dependent GTPase A [Flavobacteriales bacterium]
MKALVIKSTGSWYDVESDDGSFYKCRIKGKFRTENIKSTNPIVVGDYVEINNDAQTWMIEKLYDRKNMIVRKSVNLSKQTHIIAANIDQAILMITLQSPLTTTGFIDRFLVSAQAFGVEVILLFNKIDLYSKKLIIQHQNLISEYSKIGYRCISLSALNDNINEVKSIVENKNNLISGHSGVGKSTLINKLLGSTDILTNEISQRHDQGQHTTTFSELYRLDFGGTIIDTPGIKGFGLVNIDVDNLSDYFPEFLSLKQGCKFNNCKHINEPNCKVKEALEKGQISTDRYSNYLSMLETEESIYRTNNY